MKWQTASPSPAGKRYRIAATSIEGKILQITDKDGNDASDNPDYSANINPF